MQSELVSKTNLISKSNYQLHQTSTGDGAGFCAEDFEALSDAALTDICMINNQITNADTIATYTNVESKLISKTNLISKSNYQLHQTNAGDGAGFCDQAVSALSDAALTDGLVTDICMNRQHKVNCKAN